MVIAYLELRPSSRVWDWDWENCPVPPAIDFMRLHLNPCSFPLHLDASGRILARFGGATLPWSRPGRAIFCHRTAYTACNSQNPRLSYLPLYPPCSGQTPSSVEASQLSLSHRPAVRQTGSNALPVALEPSARF